MLQTQGNGVEATEEKPEKTSCRHYKKFRVFHTRKHKEPDSMEIYRDPDEDNVAAFAGALAPRVYQIDQVSSRGNTILARRAFFASHWWG